MAGPLPHTSQVQTMMEDYIDDAKEVIDGYFASLRHSAQFRGIYRISLATDAVLSKLSAPNMHPRLTTARSAVLRVPLLVAMGQASVAAIELRRFLEILFWCVYFTDHAVEWISFQKGRVKGYARTIDEPINFCAHREISFYMNYAKERMAGEPSGIAADAVTHLRQVQGDLNAVVHPGAIARSPNKMPPFDELSEDALTRFRKLQHRVFSQSCIVMGAYTRKQFDRLPSMHRGHFDWLVGLPLAKQIRSGPFGLTG